ncbi:MAG: ACT domain-containing protein [Actinomycetaceae bacterium]|nr:ACT domain-containing protein [Actinomycetaceae bacterium]
MVNAIMTVTGLDHVGIIATVTAGLAHNNVNITNVSQTIMDSYFTMILEIDMSQSHLTIEELQDHMHEVGKNEGLDIRIQSEAIFQAMHKL